jgi:hypothetical protein
MHRLVDAVDLPAKVGQRIGFRCLHHEPLISGSGLEIKENVDC